MVRIASAAALGLWCLIISPLSQAQDIPRAYLCENLTGSWFGAPEWKVHADGMSGQQVLLHFKGSKATSDVKWYRAGKVYYENTGVGIAMKSGFVIVALLDEQVETYVFNSGTSELLFSSTRSGSSTMPNSIKSQRATCKAAGGMVR